jgi:hypothetical protein
MEINFFKLLFFKLKKINISGITPKIHPKGKNLSGKINEPKTYSDKLPKNRQKIK